MNTFLWILQGLLAAFFLLAGAMKVTQPKEKVAEQLDWAADAAEGSIRVIGALEILAAVGLIVPPLVGIAPIMTPIAAVGLALLMVGAVITHFRRDENHMIIRNVVPLILAAVVAWGRFGPEAF